MRYESDDGYQKCICIQIDPTLFILQELLINLLPPFSTNGLNIPVSAKAS